MTTPTTARSYYRRQQARQYVALTALRREWRRMEPQGRWLEQFYDDVGPRMLMLLLAAQRDTTRASDAYVPAVLDEIGVGGDGPSVPQDAFVGTAGDGREVATLLEQSVAVAAVAYDGGLEPQTASVDALGQAERWLTKIGATLLADTARASESAAMAGRPQAGGFVRMLSPPSCSRCAILAGKFYRWNVGFLRHPRCDCRHIPAAEAVAGDITVDPGAYFDSLSPAEQNRVFTNDGAQAIRDGADMNQVVNARKGMQTAQVYGQKTIITTEGTTRRGVAYRSLNARFQNSSNDVRALGQRYFRTTSVRLMPESIYQIADGDRDQAVRLLRLHGYLT